MTGRVVTVVDGPGPLRRWADRVDLDRWDLLCLTGLVCLVAGLWIWFGLGPALAVVGGLVLALGVLGGLNAGPVEPEGG